MTKKNLLKRASLAVLLAIFSSTAAMGQEKKESKGIDWMKELKSRITNNG